MKNTTKIFVGVIVGAMLALVLLVGSIPVYGNITRTDPAPVARFQEYTFFASTTPQTVFSTTTSATSTNINAFTDSNGRIDNGYFVVAGARALTMYFSRGGVIQANAGSSKFRIQTSRDGTNWDDFNRLYQNDVGKTATSTMWITAATSTVTASADITGVSVYAVRCIVEEVTDGEHSCKATATY